ncbi:MAG: efflux RND transporter permease subunit [Spirochaetales bacterium]|nr:efflux RND transporter permease subunit [Spirochaetales bacterium]
MRLSRFAIDHPAIIIIIMIALLLFGVLALVSLNQEFLPNVALPQISVVTYYPGVGPLDIEKDVTDILEDQFSTISGLERMNSESRDSVSIIELSFTEQTDLQKMLPEVRAQISRVKGDLPSGISGEPIAMIAGVELMPIFSFVVKSDREPDLLTEFIEESILPSITRIPGVSRAEVYGGQKRQLTIELRLSDLAARNVSTIDVYQALSNANLTLPAGSAKVRQNILNVKIAGEFSSLEEIRNLAVGYQSDSYIYVRDIADVKLAYPDPEVYIDSAGSELVVVDVMKRSDGDTMEIARGVRSVIEKYEQVYGEVMSFSTIQDDSEMVRTSLFTVVRSGIIGIIMAVLVIFVFLGDVRATLIIGSSIPLSLVFAFIGMKAAGQTVNILSLSGLVVALGMIVDSSIVILENIYRYYHQGENKIVASEQGAVEMGSAVFASASTSISVFLPLAALTGIIGIVMKDISLTLVFALTASLIVSLVVVPFFTSRYLHHKKKYKHKPPAEWFMFHLENGYRRLLMWSLEHRGFIIFFALSIFLISLLILMALGSTFLPSADTGEFYVYMQFPEGSDLEVNRNKMRLAESILRREVPEINEAVFFTGFASEFSRNSPQANHGYGKVLLTPPQDRERRVQEIIAAVQRSLDAQLLDADVVVENGGFDKLLSLATEGTGFQIKLSSGDVDLLYQAASDVQEIMEQDPGIYKTSMSVEMDREVAIGDLALDDLGNLGLSTYEAAVTSRILLNGEKVGIYRGASSDRDVDIILISDLKDRPLTDDVLEQVKLINPSGKGIPYSSFTELKVEPAYSKIEHRNRMRTIVVTGYMQGEELSGIRDRIESQLESLGIPFGVEWTTGGSAELLSESMRKLLLILLIAVFLVYAVMVIQFERFRQPLIVMSSFPFCLIGVVFGLLLFGSYMSIIAFLGIIALGGIVVNNAIVLIDYMNNLRTNQGMALYEAVITGGTVRLRPILMTTFTTFFGVFPMAVSRGSGSEIYASLGQAIAGGLVTSTMISLILVPVLYFMFEQRGGEEYMGAPSRD